MMDFWQAAHRLGKDDFETVAITVNPEWLEQHFPEFERFSVEPNIADQLRQFFDPALMDRVKRVKLIQSSDVDRFQFLVEPCEPTRFDLAGPQIDPPGPN